MRHHLLFLLLIFLIPIAAADDRILSAKEAVLDVSLESVLHVDAQSRDYRISSVDVQYYLYPRSSDYQTVSSFRTDPLDHEIYNGSVRLTWDNPREKELPYAISARVSTSGHQVPVKRRIPYPLDISSLDSEIVGYTKPGKIIDSDDADIKELAGELAGGKDDLYEVVFTVATWVNGNIEYNLTTLTADVSQKASWVLETRNGVCDEMTSLFIGLLRSLNIPARYVSGISYTNSELFDFNWGPHGWAEVYFPGYGWVPFDVTYGEYGYLNPSHIELRKSFDSGQASSYYGWRATPGVTLESEQLDIEPEIISMEGSYINDPDIEIIAVPHNDVVKFGSYNAIEVKIKNLRNYYLPYAIHISKTQNTEILDKNPQLILLKPGETKKMIWRVMVSPHLADGYIYTFPFNVYSRRNESASVSFQAKESASVSYDKWDIERIAQIKEEESAKEYSENVRFVCDFENKFYYRDEAQKVICEVTNMGERELVDLSLCLHEQLRDNCEYLSMNPVERKVIELVPSNDALGTRDIQISLHNDLIAKFDTITQTVLEYPSVEIAEMDYPKEVTYGDEYRIRFVVTGKNNPKDLKVNLRVNSLSKTWRLDQLLADREFIISLDSRDLYPKGNRIAVKIIYDDDNDKSYNLQKAYNIALTDLSFLDKLVLYPKMWIERAVESE